MELKTVSGMSIAAVQKCGSVEILLTFLYLYLTYVCFTLIKREKGKSVKSLLLHLFVVHKITRTPSFNIVS